MPLHIQEAPQAPSYDAQSIQVPANIATPQATMNSVKDQQAQLNSVNNLTGGRVRRHRSQHKRKSAVIRTYKGRKQQQQGGSGAVPDGRIPIPQVGSTCSQGPQCAGAQNATFTAIHNQAQSNSINDAYAQSGGRKTRRNNNNHHHGHKSQQRKHKPCLTSTIAYHIKKVFRKVFS